MPPAEFAAEIMNAIVTDTPRVVHAHPEKAGHVPHLSAGAAVQAPAFVDANGVQPGVVAAIPHRLVAPMRSRGNVQDLVVRTLLDADISHIYHAADMDAHAAARLDLGQIPRLVTDLVAAPGDGLPGRAHPREAA